MVEIFPLHRDDPRSWACMPVALPRIVAFAEFYETEEDPHELKQRVMQAFIEGSPLHTVLVAVNGPILIGHALLTIEAVGKSRCLTVQQLQVDKLAGMTPADFRAAVESVKKLAKDSGLQLRARVKDEARVRAFRRYGFQVEATVLKCEVA